jgi:putative hemolysin
MFLPETLRVSEAMRQMRQQHQQMALVVDERGAIDGIVTMEDLVEEVVGEIYDETDRDVAGVERTADGAVIVPGGFPVHDLPDLGVDVDEVRGGTYATIAGLLLARLGHIPTEPGETVDLGRHLADVVAVGRHTITRVRLTRKPDRSGSHGSGN